MTLKVMVKLCVERQTAWCRPDWENRKQLKTHSLRIQNILKAVLTILTRIMRLTDADADFPNIHSILISWLYFFCPHSNSSNSSKKQTIRKYEQENMPGLPEPLGMQSVMETQLCEKVLEWSRENCGKLGRTRRGHDLHVGDHRVHRYYCNPFCDQHRQHYETNYPARYYFKTTIVW